MNETTKQLQALLFAAGKSMTHRQLLTLLKVDQEVLSGAIEALDAATRDSGLRVFRTDTEVALVTAPDVSECVREYLKKDITGELSKPSVETLTIIAYRGPLTKPEIEQIRGVNCSMILRNLRMRGLIDEVNDEHGQLRYTVAMPFLQHLGVSSVKELPKFVELHHHAVFTTGD